MSVNAADPRTAQSYPLGRGVRPRADFVIGYFDRIENRIITVPMKELYFDPQDHFDFQLLDEEGVTHTIPLHRIRQVFRDGELVWQR